jgi:glycerophosphoryl diester phosphodiesterase
MSDAFRVIAHRGASAHAPENTMPAFTRAVEMGATEIELDIRFSADEEIIIFHDDRLDAKTTLRGRVREHSAALLFRTEIGAWFDREHPEEKIRYAGTCLIGLRTVFEQMKCHVHYHVELKGDDDLLPLRLLQMIDAFHLRERVTVTSFSMRPLLQMQRLDPEIPLCLLLWRNMNNARSSEYRPELEGLSHEQVQRFWTDQAGAAGFRQIGVRAADVGAQTMHYATERGLGVRGWGVRNEADLRRLYESGAVGATVNWPGRALEAIQKRFGNRS